MVFNGKSKELLEEKGFMVDFNSEGTVATAPQDILKILILEKRDFVISSIVEMQKALSRGVGYDSSSFRACLFGLWYEIKSMLLNSVIQKEVVSGVVVTNKFIVECEKDLFNENSKEDVLISIFNYINNYLYKKGITKIDLRKNYDTSKAYEVNKAKGL